MTKSMEEFVQTHNGKGYDIDKSYGAQCWDGYAEYCNYLNIPYASCSYSGGARDLWEHRQELGLMQYFDVATSPKNGDVGIWTTIYGDGYGHVAMYYNGSWFGQNQGGAAYPTGGACFNLASLAAPDGGILRPKSLGPSLSWIIPESTRPLTYEEMQNNAKCVWGYLHSKGWSLQAVCGMLGNMQSESTINPNRWETDTPYPQPVERRGFGLIQWTPWTIMTEYLGNAKVSDYGNLECEYLDFERRTNPGGCWIDQGYGLTYDQYAHSTMDAGDLALIYLANRERPADPYQPVRATQAREWFTYLSGWDPIVPDGAGGGGPIYKDQLFMEILNGLVIRVWTKKIQIN